MSTWILAFLIVSLCFFIFMRTYWLWTVRKARRDGLYPEKGKATMFDVRRLIIQGEKEFAIQLYGDIFKTNYRDAKKAVEELDRSIRQKKLKA